MTFCTALAQITGVVVDAEDGAPVPYASAMYKGNKVAEQATPTESSAFHDTWDGD